MKIPTLFLTILLVATVAACGGDGKSSSGGGGATSGAGTAANDTTGGTASGTTASVHPAAGIYTGSATITIAVRGAPGQSQTGTVPITFLIDANGNVTTDPGSSFSARGRVNGATVVANVGAQLLNDRDLTCVGSLSFRGTINGNSITGVTTSSANFSCNGVPFVVTGTFSVNRTSMQRAPRAGETMENVRQYIRGHLVE